jgi:hypothetical protein
VIAPKRPTYGHSLAAKATCSAWCFRSAISSRVVKTVPESMTESVFQQRTRNRW